MYRIPSTFDPAELVGKEVSSISLGGPSTILHFEGGDSITIGGTFRLAPLGAQPTEYDSDIAAAADLAKILFETLTLAEVRDACTLRLTFSNGVLLDVLDDSDQYESFIIRIGEREIIV